MKAPQILHQSDLHSLPIRARGKVRDIYDIDADHMLIVTTDRISAFDCILPDPIPEKGRVLTSVANFWFDKLKHIIPNQLTGLSLSDFIKDPAECELLEGRAIVVKKLRALPVEAVVRGYLIGSGWKDYQKSGTVCGIALPAGLQQAEKLPKAIFTPSTKAELGAHDENISFERCTALLGQALAEQVRTVSLALYNEAATYALERGIIIADTKFEFGLDSQGTLHLIDEVLTPDSSRFWPVDEYQVGISPPSFDKQFVRDYLESLTWNKQPPAPPLPVEVIAKTAAKYREAEQRLTGH
ncbi:MAG: phosphoribosylaminoimidazolesuccinocarboxamide synthase [Methylococcaceae bacterium]|jgi:phosphoribosylaminoimidazole-succinocarboxamide synthase|nr:phosphoribosylaminoimidazolesuccinocarboxamide synthase [Methylococcaceae bacterium]